VPMVALVEVLDVSLIVVGSWFDPRSEIGLLLAFGVVIMILRQAIRGRFIGEHLPIGSSHQFE